MLTKIFGNYPQVRVIDLFISHPWSDYTKTDIAEGANISRPTLNTFFQNLEKYNLIKPSRKFGNAQLYQVDLNSPIVKSINEFQKQLSEVEEKIQIESYKEEEYLDFEDFNIEDHLKNSESQKTDLGTFNEIIDKNKSLWDIKYHFDFEKIGTAKFKEIIESKIDESVKLSCLVVSDSGKNDREDILKNIETPSKKSVNPDLFSLDHTQLQKSKANIGESK